MPYELISLGLYTLRNDINNLINDNVDINVVVLFTSKNLGRLKIEVKNDQSLYIQIMVFRSTISNNKNENENNNEEILDTQYCVNSILNIKHTNRILVNYKKDGLDNIIIKILLNKTDKITNKQFKYLYTLFSQHIIIPDIIHVNTVLDIHTYLNKYFNNIDITKIIISYLRYIL